MSTMARGIVEPTSADRALAGHSSPRVLRQTQGLIGLLLLGGAAGVIWVDQAFVAVSIVIGLGLALASLTGACPMASLIARMPWNRSGTPGCGCGSGSCRES